MWGWLKRWWRKGTAVAEIPEPSETTGRELQQFFVGLLQERNLQSYYKSREGYIDNRLREGLIGSDAREVLTRGTLKDIEDNVRLITGSGHAWPICIVWPTF